jgi:hypothetical protein
MAIYTDGTHMVSDENLEELHSFAVEIGLKRHWFEGLRKGHPHYDLMKSKKELAIENGAILVSPKKIVKICKKLYRNFSQKKSFKIANDTKDEKH